MLSAPSFQLSGNGWYATDFKDKKITKSEDSAKTSATAATAANSAPGWRMALAHLLNNWLI